MSNRERESGRVSMGESRGEGVEEREEGRERGRREERVGTKSASELIFWRTSRIACKSFRKKLLCD